MRLVVQRVDRARVEVDGRTVSEIERGLLIYIGVSKTDLYDQVRQLAGKVARLRIFEDSNGKMNLSIADVLGEALVVSQFTLYGDCRKGNRPGFDRAAPSNEADRMYTFFTDVLRSAGVTVSTGTFGAHMSVSSVNNGPVTMLLDTDERA